MNDSRSIFLLRLRDGFAGKSPYLLLGLAVLVLDQWTKWWIESHLAPYGRIEVIPNFLNLIYVENTGVAFGFLAAHGDARGVFVLVGLGLLALAFVTFYFWATPRRDRVLLTALGLVMGGAIGNLVDRTTRGAVTDFLDAYVGTYHWHTFNVADSAITIGIGLMLLGAFRAPRGDEPSGAGIDAEIEPRVEAGESASG